MGKGVVLYLGKYLLHSKILVLSGSCAQDTAVLLVKMLINAYQVVRGFSGTEHYFTEPGTDSAVMVKLCIAQVLVRYLFQHLLRGFKRHLSAFHLKQYILNIHISFLFIRFQHRHCCRQSG